MKAYQCSKCVHLQDLDERCECSVGIDARLTHREKGDSELCKKNFKLLEENKRWHETFSGEY
jgi:hypothetical protein